MNHALRSRLLTAPPAFHVWAGVPQVGGLDPPLLEFMERVITDARKLHGVAYETGAGLSTAWLLSLGLREVHSFCHQAEVCGRIDEFLESFPEERARWRHHIGPSQLTLPPHAIAMGDKAAHFCLIDGGHGLDTVFTDFVYFNYMLKEGGLLAIDDVQLGSCRLLHEFLIQPKMGYSVVGQVAKLVVLRKETARRLLGDFGWQRPFLDRLAGLLGGPP